MHLTEGELYHVFNRGNNREIIFPREQNYRYFLDGVKKYVVGYCDILAWCLMPNHFHFLIHANAASVPLITDGSIDRQQFSQGVKQLLSSYAKAINKQERRTGSLFQQKTKAKCAVGDKKGYARTVFHYIHQNPLKAMLVSRMEDWEFSSFNEYTGRETNRICNQELAVQLLDLNPGRFYEDSYATVDWELEVGLGVSYTSEV